MVGDPLDPLRALGRILDGLDVPWAVGGSVASSLHGTPRSTLDIDVLVRMAPKRAGELAAAAVGFEVDADHVRDAWLAGRSCNIFHDETMVKVDLFPAVDAFTRGELTRAVVISGVRTVSAEDIVVQKLRWYRAGGEQSRRQLDDVLGVLRTVGDRLDRAYLDAWAAEFGVADLLATVLATR